MTDDEISDAHYREIEALRAYMATGRYDTAAESLGITRTALQGLLLRLRDRYGVKGSSIAVIPRLVDKGLVTLVWQV